ncbi:uncharacterized protein [Periplaneta americana]|uniref:uncharacterized protein n=1 Tax=Periplaneta americana TaxID=6978 RepID=UPI0037E8981F
MALTKLVFLLVFVGTVYETNEQENAGMTIPMSLRDCYGNPDLYSRDKRLPMTMSTFIELIRKVELYKGAYLDLRTLSIALLHRFRMDGIERIPDIPEMPGLVPFRLTGHQYPKHRVLLRGLVPGNAYTFPNESLTAQELCTLHFMLSSCVDPWERGDEGEVCPYNLHGLLTGGTSTQHHRRVLIRDPDYPKISLVGVEVSRCPIEEGVVHTSKWDTVSLGPVVAAIAAALEPQDVQIALLLTEPDHSNATDDRVEKFERYQSMALTAVLQNTWAATLAGDLAEVAVYQGPRVQGELFIGPTGEWNDTALPRVFYMDQKNHALWQMTDAETRGGIDGLILASAVKKWVDQMNSLRLSQVLEMYYSDRGVIFDSKYRACERKARLGELPDQLQEQTTNFARVLSYTSLEAVHISDRKLEEFSTKAVEAYNAHLSNVLSGLYCVTPTSHPRVHLNVIVDGTWTQDEAMRVLAYLAEKADVCHYGSSMAVINGEDGSWITRQTFQAFDLFKLRNDTDNSTTVTPWPTRLNLKLSLAVLSTYLAQRVAEERRRGVIGDFSHVIVVLGYSSTISDDDYSQSVKIVTTFKQNNPDVRFVYLTSDINYDRFKQLSVIDDQYVDMATAASDSSPESVVTKVVNSVLTVPSRIMTAYCLGDDAEGYRDEFEDYVTPDQPRTYRIHPVFLEGAGDISIQFQGSGYGELLVCVSRDVAAVGTDCSEVTGLEQTDIKIPAPCASYSFRCPPVYLTVTATRTSVHCAEDDCRYPDQVRFLLRHEGLRCVEDPSTQGSRDSAHQSSSSITLYIAVVIFMLSTVVRHV